MRPGQDAIPTPTIARKLAEREGPVVSLFMPVTAAVPGRSQNRVRAQRTTEQALSKLKEMGLEGRALSEADKDLSSFAGSDEAPAPSVEARAAFWSSGAGLAVFGLPAHEDERVVVATAACLRPLMKAVRQAQAYRALVFSPKRIELYRGNIEGLERVEDTELPGSLEEALGSDRTPQELQFHSTGGGGDAPLYHGQGGASEERKVDLERLYHRVARALEETIGSEILPLVLMTESRHHAGLRDALQREVGLLPEGVEGNPDHLSVSELHQRSRPVVLQAQPSAREELDRAREEEGQLVSQISELLQYATMGRIRQLWVPEHGHLEGRLDPDTASVAASPFEDDLIDDLVVHVIRTGGEVFVLEGEELDESQANIFARIR